MEKRKEDPSGGSCGARGKLLAREPESQLQTWSKVDWSGISFGGRVVGLAAGCRGWREESKETCPQVCDHALRGWWVPLGKMGRSVEEQSDGLWFGHVRSETPRDVQ